MVNMLLYQIITYTIHGKIQKCHIKATHLEYHLQRGMINSTEFNLRGRDS